MKVLILLDVMNGHNGTTKNILKIARGIIEAGNEVFIVTFGKTTDYETNLKNNLYEIPYEIEVDKCLDILEFPIRVYAQRKFWYFTDEDITHIGRQLKVSRILKKRKFNPDIVILSNVQTLFALPFLNNSIKPVIFIHEPLIQAGYGPLLGTIITLLAKTAIRRKALLVSVSKQSMERSDIEFRDNIEVLPMVGFEYMPEKTSKYLEVLIDTRWTEARDPFFLLDIMDAMKDTKFYMCGKFTEERLFEQFVRELKNRGLDGSCEIHNGITQNELDTLYDRCMILMRWSAFHESGNSVAVLDAVSHECIPILDRKLGDVAEILSREMSPDIVVERNPEEFALAAKRILNDERTYNELLKKLRVLKQKRTWRAYAEDLLKLIQAERSQKFQE